MNDEGTLASALRWVMDIDPQGVIADVNAKRAAHPDESARQIARRFVDGTALRAGAEGFVMGLGSNPVVMFGAALGDVAFVLRFYAYLTATVGYLADKDYFEDPDWRDDALLILAGPKAVSRVAKGAGVELGKLGSRALFRRSLGRGAMAALRRIVLRLFGRKVTERMIFTKLVPVVGGVVGGGWNYVELRLVGQRIVAYQFDRKME